MKYYLLRDDMWLDQSAERWVFDCFKYETDRANFEFVDPPVEYMEPCTYPIDLHRDGVPTDFSFTMDSGNIPILSRTAVGALSGLAEVDEPYHHVVFEPVKIENKQVTQEYFVMIIETQIDCVDETKSEFQKYEVNDPVRPDRAGEYRSFFNLVVDPSKIGDRHIFRLRKHLGSIIVSEEVKRRFEDAGVTGAVFESVNGDGQTVA
ncbi:imm11 family protein [Halovulum sp. GXIMD14793]